MLSCTLLGTSELEHNIETVFFIRYGDCVCVFNPEVVKLAAVPAALGLASFRVYAVTEEKTQEQISPREVRHADTHTHSSCSVVSCLPTVTR